tara:strand:- start:16979 stop:17683 length:705 start_codon:yes stop_codon:yes gene_type:complete
MGKNLIQQKRGKGSSRYRAPSFRYKGKSSYLNGAKQAEIIDLVHSQGHNAPLMELKYDNGVTGLLQAPEGVKVGDVINFGKSKAQSGNIMTLRDIPVGTNIYNIESQPGDGGRFVRSSGGAAKIITKTEAGVIVLLPSNKRKTFQLECRATIGIVSGGGRKEKPFLKAGTRHFMMKSKNKLYPKVSGTSMNSVDHPFGGSSSHTKGRPTQSARNAPPGRKVGKIAPKRTGKRKK